MENPKKNIRLVSNKNSRVILPNIMTLVGVCIGLTSIKFAFDGRFELSVIAVLIAAIIDGLDGRIARLIKATSKVGKELDSLTDVISFGVKNSEYNKHHPFYSFFILPFKKIKLRIEKLDIIKNTSSVGIEIEKIRSNERWKR